MVGKNGELLAEKKLMKFCDSENHCQAFLFQLGILFFGGGQGA